MAAHDYNLAPQFSAELLAAFDNLALGRIGVDLACEALRAEFETDPAANIAVRTYLQQWRKLSGIPDDEFEALLRETERYTSEDVATSPSEIAAPATASLDAKPFTSAVATQTQTQSQAQEPPPAPRQDSRLGPGAILRNRFILETELASGAIGQVFAARDLRRQESGDDDCRVAIKVVSDPAPTPSAAVLALRHEATVGQRLSHENIVRVFDLDRDGDHTFLVMELLEGESLAQLLDQRRRRPMPRLQALHVVEGVCRALAFAHAHGVVHGDVKPGNVFLTTTGEVKLLDFGTASGPAGSDPALVPGHTPEYASCEVLEGLAPTASDDLYSAACIAYRMMAGFRPFGGVNALEAERGGSRPARIDALSPAQWHAVESGLAFRRRNRLTDIGEFLAELKGPRVEARAAQLLIDNEITAEFKAVHKIPWWRQYSSALAGAAGAATVAIVWLFASGNNGGPASSSAVSPPPPTRSGDRPAAFAASGEVADPAAGAIVRPSPSQPQIAAAREPAQTVRSTPNASPPPTDRSRRRDEPVRRVAARAAEPTNRGPAPAVLAAVDPAAALAAQRSGSTADTEPTAATLPAAGSASSEVAFNQLKMRRYEEPIYPRLASQKRTAGWVDVTFTVDARGNTGDVAVAGAEPEGVFEEAAVRAVQRWRFAPPATAPGKDGSARSRIRVRFTPEDD